MKLERRSFQQDVRSDGGGKLTGYAAVFDQETTVQGQREIIRSGAFSDSLASGRDILALADHDPARVLGRTRSGSLRLWEDARGLAFELVAANTQAGRDIVELAKRGDAGGMSFGFTIGGDSYKDDLRELRSVELFEISVVSSWPAYVGTEVHARSKLSTLPKLAHVQRRLRILTGECHGHR